MEQMIRMTRASGLPPEWDSLAGHYFQQREFLQHAEIHNPCRQRYFLLWQENRLMAAAVVYSQKIDLLTYPHVPTPLTMQVIGIPCSVSCPGIFGETHAVRILKKEIFNQEKGFRLALNLEVPETAGENAFGRTLPAIILQRPPGSWTEYRSSLRSDYRRRLDRLYRSGESYSCRVSDCTLFNQEMYGQYLGVWQRSHARLEKLTVSFFSELPPSFSLTACFSGDITAGWTISLHHERKHYFFMGGVNRSLPEAHDIYMYLLAEIVREGIESGSDEIDLGQTAEIPKMRMGGVPIPRYMEAHLSFPPLNRMLKKFSGLLEYRGEFPETRVYKDRK